MGGQLGGEHLDIGRPGLFLMFNHYGGGSGEVGNFRVKTVLLTVSSQNN